MRQTLHACMEMKPVRTPQVVASTTWDLAWFLSARPVAAFLVLALFASSAGVSYAAQNTLPGDLLYPIKTRVNEPLSGALSVSASAKAAWAMSVAGKRVEEAATLAAEGRLSASAQNDLQSNFDQHAQAAVQAIAEQATSSPDTSTEAAIRFDAQLSEYENVLAQIAIAKNTDVRPLAASISAQRSRIATLSKAAHSPESSDTITATGTAIAQMRAAARGQLQASITLAEAASGSISTSSAALVAVQLQSANDAIASTDASAGPQGSDEDLGRLQNVLSATEKLGVFLRTSAAIHARTGLVIGEPRTPAQTTAALRTEDLNQGHTKKAANQSTGASATAAASSSASGEIHETPTPSTGHTPELSPASGSGAAYTENSETDTSENATRDSSDQNEHQDEKSLAPLPVSVPIPSLR